VQAKDFSLIRTRNLINNAFKAKGIQKLIVSITTLSFKGNICIITTPEFNSDFLIQYEDIIKGVLPLVISLKKGEPWYKILIYGLLLRELDTEEGMDLVVLEIKTFNKGLEPIGYPYWITSKENRSSGQFTIGIVVVAFLTEEQAKRAIKDKLLIANFSAKIGKFIPISSTAQCNKYAGFGHLETLCKRDLKYILYNQEYNIK
jgi:hypothetical protein